MSNLNLSSVSGKAVQAATFSRGAYDRKTPFVPPAGFEPLEVKLVNPQSPDFAASAYVNPKTGELVVAYRGSDSTTDLTTALKGAANGTWSGQFTDAAAYMKQAQGMAEKVVKDYGDAEDISLSDRPQITTLTTGHSLGGILAQVVAKMYGVEAQVQDAPGAARLIDTPQFKQAALANGQPESGHDITGKVQNVTTSNIAKLGEQFEETQVVAIPALGQMGGMDTLATIGAFVANPAAGFATGAALQTVAEHSSEKIEDALHMLAGIKSQVADAGVLTLQPMYLDRDGQPVPYAPASQGDSSNSPSQIQALVDKSGKVVAFFDREVVDGEMQPVAVVVGSGNRIHLTHAQDGSSPQVIETTANGERRVVSQTELLTSLEDTRGTPEINIYSADAVNGMDFQSDQDHKAQEGSSHTKADDTSDQQVEESNAASDATQQVVDAANNTNSFTNFLDAQGSTLTPAQQNALATQISQLNLGGEGDLSFYSLPNGGALIANADGDIVGEINLSSSGNLSLMASGIDAEGNTVEVNQHITEQGTVQTQDQYNAAAQAHANASVNLFNSLMAAQQWDQLNDMGKLAVLVNMYSAVDTLGGELPGDLGGLASVLSLMQGLDSGNDLLVLRSSLQLGQMGLIAYSDYMADLAMQMADDLMASTVVDAASSAAMDAAAEAALESAAASNAAGQAVPYVSYVMAMQNFEDHPEQTIGTMAGTYFGTAIGAFFGPAGAVIGGAIGGMIGGMVGGMFGGDDDIPMREGLAHAQWDDSGHTQVVTTQDAEGGGATANSWMSGLVSGLQANLDKVVDANGQPQYGLVPNLLPSVGFKYDPDGFNLANGAKGFMYLQWTDEAGQTQTRYYDGAGSRGDGSGETLAGDFMQHAQGAIAPAWQVNTVLAHFQQEGSIDLPKESFNLPHTLADGLKQTLQVVCLTLPNTLPTETAPSSKWIDVDGDGYLEQTQWTQSNQAVLSLDLNGDGQISIGETVNLQEAGQHARTSMAWLDANGDGKLTAQDPAFAALKLWVDVNSDGKSTATELQGLTQADITAIDFSTNPPSIERSDGSQQSLTVQTLTADTLGVMFERTAGGMVETTEQLDGTGSSVLHAVNARAFDGQAAHTQGGGQDVDGSNGDVMQVDASKLATTTHHTIANSSTQTSTSVGVGDARLKSLAATPTANTSTTASTTASSANNATSTRIAFVPVGQTSAQQETLRVTDSMIESSQGLLFGASANAGLGVLAAVGMGATASAAEAAQRPVVVSEVRSSDANSAAPVERNPISSNNSFSTPSSAATTDTSTPYVTFKQVDLGVFSAPQVVPNALATTSSTGATPTANPTQTAAANTTFVQATVLVNPPVLVAPSKASATVSSDAAAPVSAWQASVNSAQAPSLGYPQVQAETLPGTEDVVLRLTQSVLLANESTPNASADPSQPALTITAVSAPLHGQVSLVNGEVLFAPDTNFHGTASFTYTVTDQYGLSTNGTATLQIAAVNDAPVTLGESVASDEDIGLIFTQAQLLANDSDVDMATDGQVLHISRVGQAEHGTVWVDDQGNLRFVPETNYHGPAKFTYWVSDGLATYGARAETPATMNLTIAALNDMPVAQGESNNTTEDTTLSIDAATLLANDSDVDMATDGQVLSISAVSNATHCTVSLVTQTDGTQRVTFVPEANFHGAATFDYTVSDGNGGTAVATAVVNLSAVNDAPVTTGETATGDEDHTLVFTSQELLVNDADVDLATDKQVLSISRVGLATNGTVTLDAQGQVHFKPDENYHGPAQFTYWVSDGLAANGAGAEVPSTVKLTILAVNDLPVVTGETLNNREEDVPLLFNPATLLANDTDVDVATDGQVLRITAIGSAQHGTVAWATQPDGSQYIAFTPERNYFGMASYQYTVSDGNGGAATTTVVVNLAAVNDAPDVVNDTLSATEDTPLAWTQADLLANDSDVDNPHTALSIVGVSNATHGSVSLNGDGSISFNPELDFFGVATFNYTVGDGAGGFSVGTATVNIAPVNDAPVAVGERLTLKEDEVATLSVASLLANDHDADNPDAQLRIQSVGNASHGSVSLVTTNGITSVVFTPELNYNGAASFTYTVSDGVGGTATANVSLDFTPVNDAPVVNNELYVGKRNVSYSLSAAALLANDTDVETPNGLTLVSLGNAQHGTVNLLNGNVVFIPEAGYSGKGSFDYVVRDADGGESTATTQIDFSHVNINPTAVDDIFSGFEDVPFSLSQAQLLVNDSDSDNPSSSLRVTSLGGATHGAVDFDAHGNVVFAPDANFNGQASFTYQVSDGDGGSTWATASVSVASVNDAPIIEDIWYGRPIYGYKWQASVSSDEYGSYTGHTWRLVAVTSESEARALLSNPNDFVSADAPVRAADRSRRNDLMTSTGELLSENLYHNGQQKPIAFDSLDTGATDEYGNVSHSNDPYRQNGGIVAYDPDGDSNTLTFSIGSTPQHGHAWVNQYTSLDAPEQIDHTQAGPYWVNQTAAWQYYSSRGDTYAGSDTFKIHVTDVDGASTDARVTATHASWPINGGGGGGCCPVAIDLQGNGLQLVTPEDSNVFSDVNDDGWRERIGWVAPEDGVLAYDANHDGKIDQVNEVSFVGYLPSARTDMEGLLAFDLDLDSKLTMRDKDWASFGVFQDKNNNGQQDEGEFISLTELGIASIGLNRTGLPMLDHNNVVFGTSTVTYTDGHQTTAADVMFSGEGVPLPELALDVLRQNTELDMAKAMQKALLFNQYANTAPNNDLHESLVFVPSEQISNIFSLYGDLVATPVNDVDHIKGVES